MGTTILSNPQKQFHAVSLSGGKDSTAMLLLMIERGMPIDMVLSADTGMEFPEMYAHLAKLDDHLYRARGLHITTLRHPQGFEYLMFDEPKQKSENHILSARPSTAHVDGLFSFYPSHQKEAMYGVQTENHQMPH